MANAEFISLREGNELNFPKLTAQIRANSGASEKSTLLLNYFEENAFF